MARSTASLVAGCWATLVLLVTGSEAVSGSAETIFTNGIDFIPPDIAGGSMVTKWLHEKNPPPGEPLNIVISAQSDPRVLRHRLNDGGLYNYFEALGFGGQCFGLALGAKQYADLGDGAGYQEQHGVMRWMFFRDPFLGTCLESIFGGNHFRVWRQETTGAVFLAASAEENAMNNHDLDMNAYDIGRNYVVGNATNTVLPDVIPPGYKVAGTTSSRGWTYRTTVEFRLGLLDVNRTEWNHFDDIAYVGREVSDGLVAIMNVEMS